MSEPMKAQRRAGAADERADAQPGVSANNDTPLAASPRWGEEPAPAAGFVLQGRDLSADADTAVEATWPGRIRGGDATAFETMVRRYTVRLRVYAERHVHAPTLAEEIVEDVFVDIWERRASWEVRTSLRRYLYGAVRKDAIDRLPDRSREAFVLARRHELSHAEIAEVMGISISTVEKHIGRAMRELRKTLATWMTAPP